MLEILKFSRQTSATVCCANRIPLPYLNESIIKDIEFYRKALEMEFAYDVSDVCDKEEH